MLNRTTELVVRLILATLDSPARAVLRWVLAL